MRAATPAVTLSATMRSDIVARGVPADRIVLAPNAVDGALLTARPDGTGFRRAHGIPDGAVVVGSVSTLNSYEGFGTLLAAAALLPRRALQCMSCWSARAGSSRLARTGGGARLGRPGHAVRPGAA